MTISEVKETGAQKRRLITAIWFCLSLACVSLVVSAVYRTLRQGAFPDTTILLEDVIELSILSTIWGLAKTESTPRFRNVGEWLKFTTSVAIMGVGSAVVMHITIQGLRNASPNVQNIVMTIVIQLGNLSLVLVGVLLIMHQLARLRVGKLLWSGKINIVASELFLMLIGVFLRMMGTGFASLLGSLGLIWAGPRIIRRFGEISCHKRGLLVKYKAVPWSNVEFLKWETIYKDRLQIKLEGQQRTLKGQVMPTQRRIADRLIQEGRYNTAIH